MQEITKALLKFQELVKNPEKNKKNPHFKSSYVNLDGLLEAIKEPLKKSDLYFTQVFRNDDEGTTLLTTKLIHKSGEYLSSSIPINPDKSTIQGLGSAITYLRRYSLESICGICGSDDDDGNEAVANDYQPRTKSRGQRKNIAPTEKQLKFLKDLIVKNKNDGGSITEAQQKWVAGLDIAACKTAIENLKN